MKVFASGSGVDQVVDSGLPRKRSRTRSGGVAADVIAIGTVSNIEAEIANGQNDIIFYSTDSVLDNSIGSRSRDVIDGVVFYNGKTLD